jgi:predicted HTH domain antitoxin
LPWEAEGNTLTTDSIFLWVLLFRYQTLWLKACAFPKARFRKPLQCEPALSLYAQSILSFGKSPELFGITRWDFASLLIQRGIPRHYGAEELAEDLEYGRGQ